MIRQIILVESEFDQGTLASEPLFVFMLHVLIKREISSCFSLDMNNILSHLWESVEDLHSWEFWTAAIFPHSSRGNLMETLWLLPGLYSWIGKFKYRECINQGNLSRSQCKVAETNQESLVKKMSFSWKWVQ